MRPWFVVGSGGPGLELVGIASWAEFATLPDTISGRHRFVVTSPLHIALVEKVKLQCW